jgi:predicted RNA binding protein YcfA (HicA-like mRNA interferase family)
MPPFPSMKAKRLLAVLMREPLNYRVARQAGSHRTLKAPGRPTLTFAFHDREEVPPHLVRATLIGRVGLEEQEALDLL